MHELMLDAAAEVWGSTWGVAAGWGDGAGCAAGLVALGFSCGKRSGSSSPFLAVTAAFSDSDTSLGAPDRRIAMVRSWAMAYSPAPRPDPVTAAFCTRTSISRSAS